MQSITVKIQQVACRHLEIDLYVNTSKELTDFESIFLTKVLDQLTPVIEDLADYYEKAE